RGRGGADARVETELRQALLQRHLTTLETGADVTTLASLRTFVTAGRSFTQATAATATNALLGVFGTGCRAQCIQTHQLAPVDSPGFCRLAPCNAADPPRAGAVLTPQPPRGDGPC